MTPEFKNTFDKVEFDISMELYMKHNSDIATINDNLGDIYSYKDLEDAEDYLLHDELELYKKALKKKCDAFDKAIEILSEDFMKCPMSLTLEKSYIIEQNKIEKALDILKGSEE